jgi:hypothetical protein
LALDLALGALIAGSWTLAWDAASLDLTVIMAGEALVSTSTQ